MILAFLISVFWEGFLVAQFLIDRKKTDLVSLQKKKEKQMKKTRKKTRKRENCLFNRSSLFILMVPCGSVLYGDTTVLSWGETEDFSSFSK